MHETDNVTAFYGTVKDAAVNYRSTKRVVLGIKDKRCQG